MRWTPYAEADFLWWWGGCCAVVPSTAPPPAVQVEGPGRRGAMRPGSSAVWRLWRPLLRCVPDAAHGSGGIAVGGSSGSHTRHTALVRQGCPGRAVCSSRSPRRCSGDRRANHRMDQGRRRGGRLMHDVDRVCVVCCAQPGGAAVVFALRPSRRPAATEMRLLGRPAWHPHPGSRPAMAGHGDSSRRAGARYAVPEPGVEDSGDSTPGSSLVDQRSLSVGERAV